VALLWSSLGGQMGLLLNLYSQALDCHSRDSCKTSQSVSSREGMTPVWRPIRPAASVHHIPSCCIRSASADETEPRLYELLPGKPKQGDRTQIDRGWGRS